jgi:serine/threonine-protein phosphatase with EF-hand domain
MEAAESVISAETEALLFDRPNKPSNISAQILKDLIKGCQDDQIISCELLMCILDEAFQTQKTYPNIRKMGTDVARRVTLVGDLHGQFSDLIVIFKREGIPSATNPYIFNGDVVDRGHKSVELCTVILGFQLLFPHSVFINRGNHEDYLMNKRYGFEQEVQTKYGEKASKLLRAFGALFSALPFCTVIDGQVFVVHGGISDDMDLEVLEHLQRQHYVSILRAAKTSGAALGDTDPAETAQVVNAVWSDPGTALGCVRNVQRGGGCVWGPDVTEAFLKRYGFTLIVRSHECCQEGHRWSHDGKILTVFSASNYYAPGSNRGSYVVFRYKELDNPKIMTFDSDPHVDDDHTVTEQVSALEKAAMKELLEKVYEKKDELLESFISADSTRTGFITIAQWAESMESVTQLNLPWLLLKDDLITITADHTFAYTEYLHEFHVEAAGKITGLGVADKLYKNVGALEYIFKLIDVDNSGYVSHKEFVMACKTLNRYLGKDVVDDDTAFQMARAVDIDKNGSIEFNEFVESFRLLRS